MKENRIQKISVGISLILLAWTPFSSASEEHPLEPVDNSSPRATLFGFIESINGVYAEARQIGRAKTSAAKRKYEIERISSYLDTSEIPSHVRARATAESAACLKEILDRVDIPPPEEVPGGEPETLPKTWRLPHTDIRVNRIDEGPYEGEYRFSALTVKQASEHYRRIESYPYRSSGPEVSQGLYVWFTTEPGSEFLSWLVDKLPPVFRLRWGTHTIWQWTGLAVVLMAGLMLIILCYRFGRAREKKFKGSSTFRYIITLIFPLAVVFIPLGLKEIIRDHLMFSGLTYTVVDFTLGLMLLFAVIGVIWGVGSRSAEVLTSSPRFSVRGMDAQLIRLICRIVSIVAVIVVFLEGGKRLGIPLSTLVAGAGISGFAIAMAAQDSLKNILGSMMIALDKPYRIDERILIGGFDGVVEDIGLRSTKIRLLNGHQAIVPNDEMARTRIENIGRRPYIRRVTDIPLPIDIESAKAERAVNIVEEILKDHEGMDEAFPPRVWLNEFRRDHLELKMIYWYHPPNYWDFTAHADRINRRILDAFEAEGIRMTVPAFTTRLHDENARPIVPPSA